VLEGNIHAALGFAYLGSVIVAAGVDPRPRLLVAAATVLVVYVAARTKVLESWPENRVIGYLGRISYSLFLIHFPVLLVVNAWGSTRLVASAGLAALGLLAGYLLSQCAGILLYYFVERRVQ
jgi:peptidoglycan/LPS O-acetylase OafA/YrhL